MSCISTLEVKVGLLWSLTLQKGTEFYLLSFVLQAVDETYVSNGRLFTLFFLNCMWNIKCIFVVSVFFGEMVYFIPDSHRLFYCQPVWKKLFLQHILSKCSPVWYPVHLMAAVVTLAMALLGLCAFGVVKQCGFSECRYCISIACSSLLIVFIMLC